MSKNKGLREQVPGGVGSGVVQCEQQAAVVLESAVMEEDSANKQNNGLTRRI